MEVRLRRSLLSGARPYQKTLRCALRIASIATLAFTVLPATAQVPVRRPIGNRVAAAPVVTFPAAALVHRRSGPTPTTATQPRSAIVTPSRQRTSMTR